MGMESQAQDNAKGRLLLFDAGLTTMQGHHLNVDLGIISEAKLRSIKTAVFGLSGVINPDVRQVIAPVPLFDIYLYKCSDISSDQQENLKLTNAAYYRALKRINVEAIRDNDVLFFHSVHSPHLEGLVRWLTELNVVKRCRVVIYMLYVDLHEESYLEIRTAIFVNFFRRLRKLTRLGLEVWAESPSMKAALDLLSVDQSQIYLGPFPSNWNRLFAKQDDPCEETPGTTLVSYLGYSKPQKGFTLVPGIIEEINKQRTDVAFFVQCDLPSQLTGDSDFLKEGFSGMRNVTCHVGSLSNDEYFRHLGRSDVVILPYSPTYAVQGSGIAAEALALGKILVAPSYLSFRDQLESYQGAGVYFLEWTTSSISQALRYAIDHKSELSARARSGARTFIEDRGPRRFFDRLFGPLCDSAHVSAPSFDR